MMARPTTAALALLAASPALAWPNDPLLTNMDSYNGELFNDSQLMVDRTLELVDTLAAAVALPTDVPAGTTGASGFEVAFGVQFQPVPGREEGSDQPSAFELASPDDVPIVVLPMPRISVRKGLPASFELLGNAGWIGDTRQGVVGGALRWAPVEGWHPWPDIHLEVGWSQYVGHPEIELGVANAGLVIGTSRPYGSEEGIRQGQVAPWLHLGAQMAVYSIRLSTEDATRLYADGAGELVGELRTGEIRPRFGGGVQITNSGVLIRLGFTWTLPQPPSFFVGMGVVY